MGRITVKNICHIIRMESTVLIGKYEYADDFSPIGEATSSSFSFCDDPRVGNFARSPLSILDGEYEDPSSIKDRALVKKRIYSSKAGIILLPVYMVREILPVENTFIFVDNPRLAFMRVVDHYYPEKPLGIHPTAVIMDCVTIGDNVSVGPYTSIGTVSLASRKDKTGRLVRFPQVGKVIIKNNVEIHSNVCIDRGALGDTVIGEGTKIDNLVHVAHNVKIGKYCAVIANSMLAGSSVIGDYSWIAPSVSVLNGIKIGINCVIGMGSVVMHDIPDNSVAYGVPARVVKTTEKRSK